MKNCKATNEKFFSLVEKLVRSLNVLDRDEKVCCGVTASQSCVLETLARKGPMNMSEISSKVNVTISTMTRILDVLVRDGMVVRRNNQADRRQIIVDLTSKGSNVARELRNCCRNYSVDILNKLPKGKKKEVMGAIEIFMDAIKSAKKKCCE